VFHPENVATGSGFSAAEHPSFPGADTAIVFYCVHPKLADLLLLPQQPFGFCGG